MPSPKHSKQSDTTPAAKSPAGASAKRPASSPRKKAPPPPPTSAAASSPATKKPSVSRTPTPTNIAPIASHKKTQAAAAQSVNLTPTSRSAAATSPSHVLSPQAAADGRAKAVSRAVPSESLVGTAHPPPPPLRSLSPSVSQQHGKGISLVRTRSAAAVDPLQASTSFSPSVALQRSRAASGGARGGKTSRPQGGGGDDTIATTEPASASAAAPPHVDAHNDNNALAHDDDESASPQPRVSKKIRAESSMFEGADVASSLSTSPQVNTNNIFNLPSRGGNNTTASSSSVSLVARSLAIGATAANTSVSMPALGPAGNAIDSNIDVTLDASPLPRADKKNEVFPPPQQQQENGGRASATVRQRRSRKSLNVVADPLTEAGGGQTAKVVVSDSSAQCPTPLPPSPPMPKPVFVACSLCGLASPFCAQTGRPHLPIAPCARCGLSTAFCPMTGAPHDLQTPLSRLNKGVGSAVADPNTTTSDSIARRSGTVAGGENTTSSGLAVDAPAVQSEMTLTPPSAAPMTNTTETTGISNTTATHKQTTTMNAATGAAQRGRTLSNPIVPKKVAPEKAMATTAASSALMPSTSAATHPPPSSSSSVGARRAPHTIPTAKLPSAAKPNTLKGVVKVSAAAGLVEGAKKVRTPSSLSAGGGGAVSAVAAAVTARLATATSASNNRGKKTPQTLPLASNATVNNRGKKTPQTLPLASNATVKHRSATSGLSGTHAPIATPAPASDVANTACSAMETPVSALAVAPETEADARSASRRIVLVTAPDSMGCEEEGCSGDNASKGFGDDGHADDGVASGLFTGAGAEDEAEDDNARVAAAVDVPAGDANATPTNNNKLLSPKRTPKHNAKEPAGSPRVPKESKEKAPQCAGCDKPVRSFKGAASADYQTIVNETPAATQEAAEEGTVASSAFIQPSSPHQHYLSVQCALCCRIYHAKCFLENTGLPLKGMQRPVSGGGGVVSSETRGSGAAVEGIGGVAAGSSSTTPDAGAAEGNSSLNAPSSPMTIRKSRGRLSTSHKDQQQTASPLLLKASLSESDIAALEGGKALQSEESMKAISPIAWLASAYHLKVCQVCLSNTINVEQIIGNGTPQPASVVCEEDDNADTTGAPSSPSAPPVLLSRVITGHATPSTVDHYLAQLLFNGYTSIPLGVGDAGEEKDDSDSLEAADVAPAAPTSTTIDEASPTHATLEALKRKTMLLHKALMLTHEVRSGSHPNATPSLEVGYSNFRMRGEGRYELVDPLFLHSILPILMREDACSVLAVLRRALGAMGARITDEEEEGPTHAVAPPAVSTTRSSVGAPPLGITDPKQVIEKLRSVPLRPMSSGCFLSTSGSENQNWHTDGPSLSGGGSIHTLMPYAINVFLPLVPMNNQNGTEFFPGSHLSEGTRAALKAHLMRLEGTDKSGTTPDASSTQSNSCPTFFNETQWEKHFSSRTSPAVPVGNALLFDYRVEHRGLGNKTSRDRPCVYLTFAQPWYLDTYNFGSKRYAQTLELKEGWDIGRSERAARRELIMSRQQ